MAIGLSGRTFWTTRLRGLSSVDGSMWLVRRRYMAINHCPTISSGVIPAGPRHMDECGNLACKAMHLLHLILRCILVIKGFFIPRQYLTRTEALLHMTCAVLIHHKPYRNVHFASAYLVSSSRSASICSSLFPSINFNFRSLTLFKMYL